MKYVDYRIDEIHENPFQCVHPFHVPRFGTGLHSFADGVVNRLDVVGRGSGADYKIVSDGGKLADINNVYILRLLTDGEGRGTFCQIIGTGCG